MKDLKIIDLDDKFTYINGSSELNNEQKETVENVYNEVENDVKFCSNPEIIRKIVIFIVCMVAIIILFVISVVTDNKKSEFANIHNGKVFEHRDVNIELGYNSDNELIANVYDGYIKINNKYFATNCRSTYTDLRILDNTYNVSDKEFNISDKVFLNKLDMSADLFYIQCVNKENTGSKEFIISKSKLDNVDSSKYTKYINGYYLYNSITENSGYAMLSNNIHLYDIEKLSGGKIAENNTAERLSIMINKELKSDVISNKNDFYTYVSAGLFKNIDVNIVLDDKYEINVFNIIKNPRIIYDYTKQSLVVIDIDTNNEVFSVSNILAFDGTADNQELIANQRFVMVFSEYGKTLRNQVLSNISER